MASSESRYVQIIAEIFRRNYTEGATSVEFDREEFHRVADDLGLERARNVGDIVYSFRYRRELPDSVQQKAPPGTTWVIVGRGSARYAFEARRTARILPSPALGPIKMPNSTPGLVDRYALSDEQALLARLRYNRLIDVFTGVTAYSLQNHLRSHVRSIGQVETDEVYIGVDAAGRHYVFPVQAKGGADELGVVQAEQDLALCAHVFPSAICRPIAAQFITKDVIAMFELVLKDEELLVRQERHYQLVEAGEISDEDLESYRDAG